MSGIEISPILWILACIQAMGLISAIVARVGEGSPRQTASHAFFFACLAMVGATTVMALGVGPGCWITSATTLAVMVLIVTCDFSRSRQIIAD